MDLGKDPRPQKVILDLTAYDVQAKGFLPPGKKLNLKLGNNDSPKITVYALPSKSYGTTGLPGNNQLDYIEMNTLDTSINKLPEVAFTHPTKKVTLDVRPSFLTPQARSVLKIGTPGDAQQQNIPPVRIPQVHAMPKITPPFHFQLYMY